MSHKAEHEEWARALIMCVRLFIHASELIIHGVDVATYVKVYIDLAGSMFFRTIQ